MDEAPLPWKSRTIVAPLIRSKVASSVFQDELGTGDGTLSGINLPFCQPCLLLVSTVLCVLYFEFGESPLRRQTDKPFFLWRWDGVGQSNPACADSFRVLVSGWRRCTFLSAYYAQVTDFRFFVKWSWHESYFSSFLLLSLPFLLRFEQYRMTRWYLRKGQFQFPCSSVWLLLFMQ